MSAATMEALRWLSDATLIIGASRGIGFCIGGGICRAQGRQSRRCGTLQEPQRSARQILPSV